MRLPASYASREIRRPAIARPGGSRKRRITFGKFEQRVDAADSLGSDSLATSDPGNALRQRELSVSYDRVGNLSDALKSYSDSLAIAERLAKSDPGNAEWQRDLSVSYIKVGDVLVAQGNLLEALKTYQHGLAIADRLAQSDPGNAHWQRDLAKGEFALVHKQSGDETKALDFLRQGQAIMARLTKLSPDNATWKQHLALFDRLIAELAETPSRSPHSEKAPKVPSHPSASLSGCFRSSWPGSRARISP